MKSVQWSGRSGAEGQHAMPISRGGSDCFHKMVRHEIVWTRAGGRLFRADFERCVAETNFDNK